MKTTNWSLTYWFTEGRNRDTFQKLVEEMPTDWMIEGQEERGHESGKLHMQLRLKTPQTRGTRIAKFFPKTDIDEARNVFALQNYVHKEDTRVAEFKTVENRSPQWHVVCDKFFDWLVSKDEFLGFLKDDLDERESPRLALWDKFINISITEGMRVELIGVNPQYRSAIRRYWEGFFAVAERRKTDVDKCLDKTEDNLAPPPQVLQIPTFTGGGIQCVKKS